MDGIITIVCMTRDNSPDLSSGSGCACSELKMAMSIQKPAKYEIHAVIRFLHTKGDTADENHHQVVSVYNENVIYRRCV